MSSSTGSGRTVIIKRDKHRNAISGVTRDKTTDRKRRQRSGDVVLSATKREKTDQPKTMSENPKPNENMESEDNNSKSMTKSDFIEWYAAALDEPKIAEKIKKIQDQTTEDLYNRIDIIDEINYERDNNVRKLIDKVEAIEVGDRASNLILTNKKIEPLSKENVAKSLEELMGEEVKKDDIHYVTKINAQTQKIKIVFYNKGLRDRIYGLKSKLKGKKIYLTEDLTPEKAHVYYLARDAVKKGNAIATWTTDGRVIVKKSNHTKPEKINTPHELMRHLGIEPLINENSSDSSIDTP